VPPSISPSTPSPNPSIQTPTPLSLLPSPTSPTAFIHLYSPFTLIPRPPVPSSSSIERSSLLLPQITYRTNLFQFRSSSDEPYRSSAQYSKAIINDSSISFQGSWSTDASSHQSTSQNDSARVQFLGMSPFPIHVTMYHPYLSHNFCI
jgi:hypothetical protein